MNANLKRSKIMRLRIVLAMVLLLIVASATAEVRDTEEFFYDINAGGRISLENVNGDILIIGSSGDAVSIVAHKKASNQEYLDGLEIDIKAEAEFIRIETKHPKSSNVHFGWGDNGSGSVSYELSVPSNINLDLVSTINGEVDISGVSGDVKAKTVNGGLVASDLASDVGLDTTNGSIKADFQTLNSGQRVSARTVNGKIVFRLPEDASARVTAETVNGSIDADDFGLEPEKGYVGRDLDGQIGNGSARVRLDTLNGSIRLTRK
jgi:DUF4097 and DUF4098 domain-containing protein YvlB